MFRLSCILMLSCLMVFLAACGAGGPAPTPPTPTPTRPASPTSAPQAQAPPATLVPTQPAGAPNAALPATPAPGPSPTRRGGEAKAAVQPTPTPVPAAQRPPTADSSVRLFVLPNDGYTPVINAINSAQKSIRLVMYLLLDDDVVNTLIEARKRGVEVRVMVEPEPMGGGSQADINKLKAGSVFVKDSPQTFRFTHQKTLIVDDRVALIMTLNLTRTSFTRNREYGVIDTQPDRVAEISRVFDADWQRETVQVSHPDLVWSPINARERLLQFLRSAQSSVDIQVEGLSDNEIEDALGALVGRGVRVRVLLPTLEAGDSRLRELEWIVRRGVRLRRLDEPFQHMKMIVVDGRRAWIGSQNFSANALDNNRELGIFISDAASLGRLTETFETDWNKGA